jgi:alkylation response protein AidB-like acyl-CoA dehydrogenase
MDFKLTDEQVKLRQDFFDVCRELEKLKPAGFTGLESTFGSDAGWEYHLHCGKEFVKRGWTALDWPAEYGGHGTMMDRVFFAEARGYYDIPGVDIFGVEMLAPTIIHAGTDDVKRRFLPSIAKMETTWGQLWSEPNAGSDLASLTTTAVRKGDYYVLNGQKTWSTGCHRVSWSCAVVRTNPGAEKKHQGLTFLLLDMKTPGITVKPLKYMDGGHYYNEVFLDDVHVPTNNVVGKENQGWAVTQMLAGFERSNLGAIMCMQRQIEDLVKYCNETKASNEPLACNPVIRHRLAQLACELEAARCLAYRIADAQNKKEMAPFDASAVKIISGELQARVAHFATELFGPYGQVRLSRWAKFDGIYETWYHHQFRLNVAMGTNEIQRNIIAWNGLNLPRMK